MEHGAIYNVNRGDKKTDGSFMHFITENFVEKCFRDLIIEIHPPRFQLFFSKPEMNVENGCLFFCFILFNLSLQLLSIENYRKLKLTGRRFFAPNFFFPSSFSFMFAFD